MNIEAVREAVKSEKAAIRRRLAREARFWTEAESGQIALFKSPDGFVGKPIRVATFHGTTKEACVLAQLAAHAAADQHDREVLLDKLSSFRTHFDTMRSDSARARLAQILAEHGGPAFSEDVWNGASTQAPMHIVAVRCGKLHDCVCEACNNARSQRAAIMTGALS